MDTAELVQTLVAFLLGGGGLAAVGRYVRDRKLNAAQASTAMVATADAAAEVATDVLKEVVGLLDLERRRNESVVQLAETRTEERNRARDERDQAVAKLRANGLPWP